MPTYFYIQKTTPFRQVMTPIPFELQRVNVGGAMDAPSGIFTTPRNGRYFFSLSGVAKFGKGNCYIGVSLKLNARPIGRGHTEEHMDSHGFQTFSIQSVLDLKAGDKVWLEIDYLGNAELHEDAHNGSNLHYTHFSGWLMHENISITLDLE